MTIGKQITERLRRLADGDQAVLEVGDEKRLVLSGEPFHATLAFFDHDRYSVTLRELTVGKGGATPPDARAYLSTAAAAVARRLSFLEEPLAVWELDGSERVAQLRSSPPLRDGDEVAYWEVSLWAGEQPSARVVRCRWAPGMPEREIIAYPATFALVARMADSLAEALATADE
jgi:hypothetical protein